MQKILRMFQVVAVERNIYPKVSTILIDAKSTNRTSRLSSKHELDKLSLTALISSFILIS